MTLLPRLVARMPASWPTRSPAAKGTAQLHDAWFGYDRFQFLQVKVGLQDVPFSRYALTGAGDGALVERPFAVRAMAPFHQLGAVIEGAAWCWGQNDLYGNLGDGLKENISAIPVRVQGHASQATQPTLVHAVDFAPDHVLGADPDGWTLE